jgi:hypothetical protein
MLDLQMRLTANHTKHLFLLATFTLSYVLYVLIIVLLLFTTLAIVY